MSILIFQKDYLIFSQIENLALRRRQTSFFTFEKDDAKESWLTDFPDFPSLLL